MIGYSETLAEHIRFRNNHTYISVVHSGWWRDLFCQSSTGSNIVNELTSPSSIYPLCCTATMFSRQILLRSAWAAIPSRAIAPQARFYAGSSPAENVKSPVALFGLDGTYATALVCRFQFYNIVNSLQSGISLICVSPGAFGGPRYGGQGEFSALSLPIGAGERRVKGNYW